MTTRLLDKINALKYAEQQVIEQLRLLYPIGSVVRVTIMHGQVSPSYGEVRGYKGGIYAEVSVRLESRKRIERNVPAKNILLMEQSNV